MGEGSSEEGNIQGENLGSQTAKEFQMPPGSLGGRSHLSRGWGAEGDGKGGPRGTRARHVLRKTGPSRVQTLPLQDQQNGLLSLCLDVALREENRTRWDQTGQAPRTSQEEVDASEVLLHPRSFDQGRSP